MKRKRSGLAAVAMAAAMSLTVFAGPEAAEAARVERELTGTITESVLPGPDPSLAVGESVIVGLEYDPDTPLSEGLYTDFGDLLSFALTVGSDTDVVTMTPVRLFRGDDRLGASGSAEEFGALFFGQATFLFDETVSQDESGAYPLPDQAFFTNHFAGGDFILVLMPDEPFFAESAEFIEEDPRLPGPLPGDFPVAPFYLKGTFDASSATVVPTPGTATAGLVLFGMLTLRRRRAATMN